jgi:ABC-type glycerol-3-phosphate transport system permease component
MKVLSLLLPNRESLPKTTLDYVSLIFLFFCMLFFLMPLYVMVVTGFKDSTHVSL